MMSEELTVYSARVEKKIGFVGALTALAEQFRIHRWHIGQLFIRDFSNSYQLTRFGVIWNYLLPVVPITVWVLLSGLRMFPSFNGVSSVVWVTMGVTLWFLFSGFLMLPITTVEAKIREGSKSDLPLIGFVIVGYAQLFFDTMVRLIATAGVFAFFQGVPDPAAIAVPLVVVAAFLFFAGIGLILAVFNLAYRDIAKVVAMVLQYGMLLSGIVFPITEVPVLSDFVAWNPFFVFVDSIRTLCVAGTLSHPAALAGFSASGLLIFLFACRFFYLSENRLKGFS